ncbi:5-hydroxytryptamine receptor-like [Argopecten irradians]|uniref:5-hydroxytryptamine receptor-like n=1 Tax=Argopecten irradians TaxID=31199 RepID=UPI0037241B53
MINTSSNGTQDNEPPALTSYQSLIVWTTCTVAIFGIAEHFLILLMTIFNKSLRKKPFMVSILLLSSSDVLLGVALFFRSLISIASLRQAWICGLTIFIIHLGLVSSLVHTLVICVDRYQSLKPVPMEVLSVRKRQMLTVIIIVICSLFLAIPYPFTVKQSTVAPCSIATLFQENQSYVLAPVRSIALLAWICTVIMYIGTARNFRKVRRRTDTLKKGQIMRVKRLHDTATQRHCGNTTMSCSTSYSHDAGASLDASNRTQRRRRNSKGKLDESIAEMKSLYNVSVREDCSVSDSTILSLRELRLQTIEKCTGSSNSKVINYENRQREVTPHFAQIEKHSSKKNKRQTSPTGLSETPSSSRYLSFHRRQTHHSRVTPEVKAFRIVSVVFVVFLITMTPQFIIGFVKLMYPVSKYMEYFCNFLAVSSIVTNPFMYAFVLKEFRRALRCK